MTNIIDFTKEWTFTRKEGEESIQISLPHTWNAVDGQDGGNDYYRGTCIYEKRFECPDIPKAGRAVLFFEGAAMTAEVFVNGWNIKKHEGGFSAFSVDITGSLKQGENILKVTVDNSKNETVYPQMADFTFYGGIYRPVSLILCEKNGFDYSCKTAAPLTVSGQVINGPDYEGMKAYNGLKDSLYKENTGKILLSAAVRGNGSIHVVLSDAEGKAQAEETVPYVSDEESGTCVVTPAPLFIENIHLWNGVKDPYLYNVSVEITASDGTVQDRIEKKIGFRTFAFDSEKGFFLNGESYPLRGVSRHQDYAEVGNAISEENMDTDIALIREIGANTVRLAHYQHSQAFYDRCDRAGLIIWAEIPYISKHMDGGRENTLCQMEELVLQSMYHPAIITWGLSNEITASGKVTEALLENHHALNDLCHRLDPTRPTTMAHVFMLETDSPLVQLSDICSYNLYYGWYVGELEENEQFFDGFHKAYPNRIIGLSEYGADANPEYHSSNPERGDYSEEYQCAYHEHMLKCIGERPYLWATHLWNLFDFAADGRDEGGAHGLNQKGLVSIDRKVKKDAFYLYKAFWSSVPFLHLTGKRYVDRVESTTKVKVYANIPAVSLSIDGKLLMTKTGEHIFEFDVPISGEHTITVSGEGEYQNLTDSIRIRKVEQPNPAYALVKKEAVVNWFNKEDLDPACYSIQDTMGDIMQNPAGATIIGRLMSAAKKSRGEVAEGAGDNPVIMKMMSKMTVEKLLKMAGDAIPAEQIKQLNAALQKIKKPVVEALKKIELTKDSKLSDIFAFDESRNLFDKWFPGFRSRIEGQAAAVGMSVSTLVQYSKGLIQAEKLAGFDAEVRALEIFVKSDKYNDQTPRVSGGLERKEPEVHSLIYPGKPWFDTEGKRIQAHGGQVFYENGTYYWYGENKDHTDGKNGVWTWGIRAYASEDLINWRDLGLIIAPDYKDDTSGLYPEKHVDRPHIIKNEKTGKYVCWIKQSGDEACFIILTADCFTGPYTIVKQNYRPEGIKVGDFDMAVRDGNAYMFMDADHAAVAGYKLTEDYTAVDHEVSRQYQGLHAPFCREGIALFEREGKEYLLTSSMSGYIPNPSDSAVADGIESTYTSVGNPHVCDESKASFNSQISQVFKVEGKKDLFIAVADRWVPGYMLDGKRSDLVMRFIANHFEPDKYPVTEEEKKEMMSSPMLDAADTSIADYVWLPVTFDNGLPKIYWYDSWTPETFE